MANVDFPRGFQPYRGKMDTEEYPIATNNGEIFADDLVELRTDGFYYQAQATSLTLIGTAAEYKAANSGGKIKVYSDPNMRFLAQASGAEIDAQTDLDLNYNFVVAAGDPITKRSKMEINSATGAATSTLPIKVLRVVELVPASKNTLGANVLLECIINNHLHKSLGV